MTAKSKADSADKIELKEGMCALVFEEIDKGFKQSFYTGGERNKPASTASIILGCITLLLAQEDEEFMAFIEKKAEEVLGFKKISVQ
jgi:hypothetical protein